MRTQTYVLCNAEPCRRFSNAPGYLYGVALPLVRVLELTGNSSFTWSAGSSGSRRGKGYDCPSAHWKIFVFFDHTYSWPLSVDLDRSAFLRYLLDSLAPTSDNNYGQAGSLIGSVRLLFLRQFHDDLLLCFCYMTVSVWRQERDRKHNRSRGVVAVSAAVVNGHQRTCRTAGGPRPRWTGPWRCSS